VITQDVNNNLRIIYASNKRAEFNDILRNLGYKKITGELEKDVIVTQNSIYYPSGGTSSLESIKIVSKGVTTHIIDDSVSFNYNSIDNITRNLKHFGNKYLVKLDNKNFVGEFFKQSEIAVKNYKGDIIIFESESSNRMTLRNHDFLHKMKMNNSRMIMPLLRKYVDVITLLKGKRHLLTGYANIMDYLAFMKKPSRDFLLSLTGHNADFTVNLDKNPSKITLKVNNILKDGVLLDFIVNDKIYTSGKTPSRNPIPHILVNTKPVQLRNHKLLYFTAKYKHTTVFVIPLMLKSDKALKNLRGGFNLLA